MHRPKPPKKKGSHGTGGAPEHLAVVIASNARTHHQHTRAKGKKVVSATAPSDEVAPQMAVVGQSSSHFNPPAPHVDPGDGNKQGGEKKDAVRRYEDMQERIKAALRDSNNAISDGNAEGVDVITSTPSPPSQPEGGGATSESVLAEGLATGGRVVLGTPVVSTVLAADFPGGVNTNNTTTTNPHSENINASGEPVQITSFKPIVGAREQAVARLDFSALRQKTTQDKALHLLETLSAKSSQLKESGNLPRLPQTARTAPATNATVTSAGQPLPSTASMYSRDPVTNLRECIKHMIAHESVYGPIHEFLIRECNYVISMWCEDQLSINAAQVSVADAKEMQTTSTKAGPSTRPGDWRREEAERKKADKQLEGSKQLLVKENVFDKMLANVRESQLRQIQVERELDAEQQEKEEEWKHDVSALETPTSPFESASVQRLRENSLLTGADLANPVTSPGAPGPDFSKMDARQDAIEAMGKQFSPGAKRSSITENTNGLLAVSSSAAFTTSPPRHAATSLQAGADSAAAALHAEALLTETEAVRAAVAHEVAQLRRKLRHHETMNEHLKGELEDAQVHSIEKEDTLRTLEHQLRQADDREQAFKKEAIRQQDRITALRKEIVDVQQQSMNDHRKREAKEQTVERRLADSKVEITQLYRHLHSSEHQNIILEREISNSHMDLEEFESKYFKSLKDFEDAQTELGARDEEVARLVDSSEAQQAVIDELIEQMKEMSIIAGHSTVADHLLVQHPCWSLYLQQKLADREMPLTDCPYYAQVPSFSSIPLLQLKLVARGSFVVHDGGFTSSASPANPETAYDILRNVRGVGFRQLAQVSPLSTDFSKLTLSLTEDALLSDMALTGRVDGSPNLTDSSGLLSGGLGSQMGSLHLSGSGSGSAAFSASQRNSTMTVVRRAAADAKLGELIARYAGVWPPPMEPNMIRKKNFVYNLAERETQWPVRDPMDVLSLLLPPTPSTAFLHQRNEIAELLQQYVKTTRGGKLPTEPHLLLLLEPPRNHTKPITAKHSKLTRADLRAVLTSFWAERYQQYLSFAEKQQQWLEHRKEHQQKGKELPVVSPPPPRKSVTPPTKSPSSKKKGSGGAGSASPKSVGLDSPASPAVHFLEATETEPEDMSLPPLERFPTFLEALAQFLNDKYPVKEASGGGGGGERGFRSRSGTTIALDTTDSPTTLRSGPDSPRLEKDAAAAAPTTLPRTVMLPQQPKTRSSFAPGGRRDAETPVRLVPEFPSDHPLASLSGASLSQPGLDVLFSLYHASLDLKEADPEFHLFYLLCHQLVPEQLLLDLLQNLAMLFLASEVGFIDSTTVEEGEITSTRQDTQATTVLPSPAVDSVSFNLPRRVSTASCSTPHAAPDLTPLDAGASLGEVAELAPGSSINLGGGGHAGDPNHPHHPSGQTASVSLLTAGTLPFSGHMVERQRSVVGTGPPLDHARRSIVFEVSTDYPLHTSGGGGVLGQKAPRVTLATMDGATPTQKRRLQRRKGAHTAVRELISPSTGFMPLTKFCDALDTALYRHYCTPPSIRGEEEAVSAESKLELSHLELLRLKFCLGIDQPSNVVKYADLFKSDIAGRPSLFLTTVWELFLERFLSYQTEVMRLAVESTVVTDVEVQRSDSLSTSSRKASRAAGVAPMDQSEEPKDEEDENSDDEDGSSSEPSSSTDPAADESKSPKKVTVKTATTSSPPLKGQGPLVDMQQFKAGWLFSDPGRTADIDVLLRLLTQLSSEDANSPRGGQSRQRSGVSKPPAGGGGTTTTGGGPVQRPATVGKSTVTAEAKDIDHWYIDQWRDLLPHNNCLLLREGCEGEMAPGATEPATAQQSTLGDHLLACPIHAAPFQFPSQLPQDTNILLDRAKSDVWHHKWIMEQYDVPDYFPRALLLQRLRTLYVFRVSDTGISASTAATSGLPPVQRKMALTKVMAAQHDNALRQFTQMLSETSMPKPATDSETANGVTGSIGSHAAFSKTTASSAAAHPYEQLATWAEVDAVQRVPQVPSFVASSSVNDTHTGSPLTRKRSKRFKSEAHPVVPGRSDNTDDFGRGSSLISTQLLGGSQSHPAPPAATQLPAGTPSFIGLQSKKAAAAAATGGGGGGGLWSTLRGSRSFDEGQFEINSNLSDATVRHHQRTIKLAHIPLLLSAQTQMERRLHGQPTKKEKADTTLTKYNEAKDALLQENERRHGVSAAGRPPRSQTASISGHSTPNVSSLTTSQQLRSSSSSFLGNNPIRSASFEALVDAETHRSQQEFTPAGIPNPTSGGGGGGEGARRNSVYSFLSRDSSVGLDPEGNAAAPQQEASTGSVTGGTSPQHPHLQQGALVASGTPGTADGPPREEVLLHVRQRALSMLYKPGM